MCTHTIPLSSQKEPIARLPGLTVIFTAFYRSPKPSFSSESTEELPQNPHFQLKYICFIFHIVASALHPTGALYLAFTPLFSLSYRSCLQGQVAG